MLDRFTLYNARCSGGVIAFGGLSRNFSFSLLEATVSRVAYALDELRSLNLRHVAVQCADTWRHWVLVLALGRLGIASSSLVNSCEFTHDMALLQPELVIVHGRGLPLADGRLILGDDWFDRVLSGVEKDEPSAYYPPVSVKPSALCRVAVVSGTRRDSHLIELSFGEVEAALLRLMYQDMNELFMRAASVTEGVGNGKPHLLCTVGPQSISGYLMAGAALAAGTTLRSNDSQNIGREIVSAPSLLMVMTPAHLEHALKALPPQMKPLSHVYITVVGGGLSQACLERTRAHFTPHVQVIYGADESGAVTAIAAEKRSDDKSVGVVLPWADVQIVDAEGRVLTQGEVGEIRLRGGGVVRGYVDDSQASAASFREGWFYPGDKGYFSASGELHLCGRVDALVSIGGAKFDCGLLEDILRSEPAIEDVGVFLASDAEGQEGLYVALVAHERFDDASLSQKMRQRYPTLPPLVMIWVRSIPRNEQGGVDRTALRESLEGYIRQELMQSRSEA